MQSANESLLFLCHPQLQAEGAGCGGGGGLGTGPWLSEKSLVFWLESNFHQSMPEQGSSHPDAD